VVEPHPTGGEKDWQRNPPQYIFDTQDAGYGDIKAHKHCVEVVLLHSVEGMAK